MKTAETISHYKNGITSSDAAAHYSLAFNGGVLVGHECSTQLDNITASTDLFVAYVDGGRSTEDDWRFSFTRIAAGQAKLANSLREFNVGEAVGTYSTPTHTITSSTAGNYYVCKILVPAADICTLGHATVDKCARKTSTTIIPLTQGQNTFIIKTADTSNVTLTLTTGGSTVQVSCHLVTNWTANQLMINY